MVAFWGFGFFSFMRNIFWSGGQKTTTAKARAKATGGP
jgi:hypothetical protein